MISFYGFLINAYGLVIEYRFFAFYLIMNKTIDALYS